MAVCKSVQECVSGPPTEAKSKLCCIFRPVPRLAPIEEIRVRSAHAHLCSNLDSHPVTTAAAPAYPLPATERPRHIVTQHTSSSAGGQAPTVSWSADGCDQRKVISDSTRPVWNQPGPGFEAGPNVPPSLSLPYRLIHLENTGPKRCPATVALAMGVQYRAMVQEQICGLPCSFDRNKA